MYLTVIFVRTEDFVQAVGAKSRYFPPMSLVVGNLRFTRIIRKLDNPRMDNRESTVLSLTLCYIVCSGLSVCRSKRTRVQGSRCMFLDMHRDP